MINSNIKGKTGEREARDLWREFFPGCERSYGQSRKGYELPDIIGGKCKLDNSPIERYFYIDAKRPKKEPSLAQIKKWIDKLKNDYCLYEINQNICNPAIIILTWRANYKKCWTVWSYGISIGGVSWDEFKKSYNLLRFK